MMICTFDTKKDLARVHQVLFDSLLENKNATQALNDLVASGYFQIYNDILTNTSDIESFQTYLTDVIEKAFNTFNTFSKSLTEFDSFKNEIDNGFNLTEAVSNMIYNIADIKNKISVSKSLNGAVETSPLDIVQEQPVFKEPADVNVGQNQTSFVYSRTISIANIKVNNVRDIENNYYPGSKLAFKLFSSDLKTKIIKQVIIPVAVNEVATELEFNKKIQNIKSDLLNVITGGNEDHYDENYSSTKVNKIIKDLEDELDSLDISGTKLNTWVKSELKNTQLQRYNAYVTLKHFDKLIGEFSGNMIAVNGKRDLETNTIKYYPANSGKLRSGFKDSGIDVSALDQVSDFFNLFISSINLIDLETGNVKVRNLERLQLNNSLISVLKSVSTTDPIKSIRQTLQSQLMNHMDNKVNDLNKTDYRIILSYYLAVHADQNLETDPVVQKFSNGDTTVIKNIKNAYGDSLYAKYMDYKPIGDNINLYEAVITDTLSMDKAHYFEVYYDGTNNTLEYRNFTEKESDKQYRILKNITTTSTLEDSINFDYYKSLGNFDVNGLDVTFNLPGNVVAIYNVKTGSITDKDGIEFKFEGLNVPKFEEDVSDLSMTNNTGKYKAYFDLIEAFDAYLKQPLSSENYRLLDMIREQVDTKDNANHIGIIMKIMGNVAFLNKLNLAEGSLNASVIYDKDNDIINDDIEEISSRLKQGLTELGIEDELEVFDLWNAQQKMFNLELTNDSDSKSLQEIKKYAEVLNDFYNTSNKSVVINTQGNAVPMFIISSLGQRTHLTADKVRRKGYFDRTVNGKNFTVNSPLKHNLLVSNPGLLKNIEINSGIKGLDGNTVKSGDATFAEIFDAAVRGNFLSNYIKRKNGVTGYQSANFSDKEKHITANIFRDVDFVLNGKRGTIGLGENQFSTDEIAQGYMEYSDVYYKNISKGLLLDYYEVFTNNNVYDDDGNQLNVNGLTYTTYNNSRLATIAPDLLNGDIVANVSKAKLIFKDEKEVLSELDHLIHVYNKTSDPKLLQNLVDAIQGRSKGVSETKALIRSISYVNDIIADIPGNAINEAFNFANVDVIKTYHFDKNQKNNVHKTLIQNLNKYSSSDNARLATMQEIETNFIKSIVGKENFTEDNLKNHLSSLEGGTEFTLDLLNNEGKVDNNLKNYISLAGDEILPFIDSDLGRLKLFITNADGSFTINPLLKRFLWEQNLFGRSFHHLAVGSEMGHPVKNAKEGTERSASFTAQNKRNVIYNASYNSLHMNGVSGITGKTKLLTIADFAEDVAIPYGLKAAVEPSDGSAMNNPLHLFMHNKSMPTPLSTNSLKNIQGGMDASRGIAYLLKYAEFPTLNANIRNGYNDKKDNIYHMFMYRTMSEKFDNVGENGNKQKIHVDITQDYTGVSTQHILDRYEPTFVYNSKLESDFNMDFKDPITQVSQVQEGELVTLKKINSNGDNTYVLHYEIKNDLNETRPLQVAKIIDNLYDFWGALGGAYGVTYDSDEVGRFERDVNTVMDGYNYSEDNVKALFEYMNLVGSRIYNEDNTINKAVFRDNPELAFDTIMSYYEDNLDVIIEDESEIANFNTKNTTQFNVIQPLKINLIGRATFASGAKVGATNVNTVNNFVNPKKKLKYSTIPSMYYGPQLSAEHAVGDHDEVTEQSQIISALNFIGHSPEHAEKAFKAISGYISGKLNDLMVNVFKFENPELRKQIDVIVRKVVSKALDGRDITGMANFVVDKVRQEIINNLPPIYQVPFSSPDVYNTVYNALNNFLSKEGVKRKLKGLAAVLKPNLMTVRNVTIKTDNGYVTTVMQEDEYAEYLRELDGNEANRYLNYSENMDFDVDMFTTVQKLDESGNVLQNIYLDNISKYIMVKQDMLSNPNKYRIDLEASRVLKPTTTSWTINGVTYNNYDMQVTALPNMGFGYDEIIKQIKKLNEKITNNNLRNLYTGEIFNNDKLLEEIASLEQQAENLDIKYGEMLEFTNINGLIDELNEEQEVISVEDNGNTSFTVNTSTRKVDQITRLPESLADFNSILDKGDLNEDLRNIFKNLGNQEYKMLHKGYVKPNVHEINRILNGDGIIMDRVVYDGKGNNLGSISDLVLEDTPLNTIYFKVSNLKTNPGEILAPGIYRKQLKLSTKHTPNNIRVSDFKNILERSRKPAIDTYDMLLPNANGDHMYVLFKDSIAYNNLKNSGMLNKDTRDNIITDVSTNKHYLKNGLEDRVHELPSDDLYTVNKNGKDLTFVVIDKDADANLLRNIVKDKSNGFKKIKVNYAYFNNLESYMKFADVENSNVLKNLNNYINSRRSIQFEKLNDALNGLKALNGVEDQDKNIANITSVLSKLDKGKPFTPSEITRIQSIIEELELAEKLKEDAYITDIANKQYASVKASLHISAARIPGQHYQSFMGQKIVGFTDNEENIAYVSNTHMLITGEDFDIDKAYLSYYGLNKENILVGWANDRFWRGNSEKDLLNSLRLPVPEKVTVNKNLTEVSDFFKDSIKGISYEEALALANPGTADYSLLVDALNTAAAMLVKRGKTDDKAKTFFFRHADRDLIDSNLMKKALDYIDDYFNNGGIDVSNKDYNLAYTNAIVSGIINSANDVRNLNEQLSPVSFGIYGDMAKTSKKGTDMKLMDYENFADILKAQIYAMVGKNVISIAAAGGLKPYSILAQNYTMISRTGEGPRFVFRASNQDIVNNRLSTIDLNDPLSRTNVAVHITNDAFGIQSTSQLNDFSESSKNQYFETLNKVKKALDKRYLRREDAAFALSAILSAATDNAKELILGAINAGPDTVGYYMAAAIANIPTAEIAKVMTSDTVEAIDKFSSRNIIKGVQRSFDDLVTQLATDKLFKIEGYFPRNSTKAISDKIWELEDSNQIKIKSNNGVITLSKLMLNYFKDSDKPESVILDAVRKAPKLTISILFSSTDVLSDTETINNIVESIGDVYISNSDRGSDDETNNGYSLPIANSAPRRSPEEMMSEQYMDDDQVANDYENNYYDDSTSEYVEDYDEFLQGHEFQNIYFNKIKSSLYLNRYINDARRLMMSIDDNVLQTLIDLKPFKDDLSTLGKMAGVNQGIKNNYLDGYNYLNNYKKYIDEINPNLFTEVASQFKEAADYDITEFLYRYINDDVFKGVVNERLKSPNRINLLDLMDNTPHMQSMLELAISAVKLNKNISFKTRLFDKVMQITTDLKIPVTRKNFNTVENYVDELVILTGLKQMNESNKDMLTFNTNNGSTINISTLQGRIDFINWMESTVINDLRKGLVVTPTGAYRDINLKNNDFIKNITPDSKLDTISKKRFNYLTIRANTTRMQSDQDILRLENITHDFNKLRHLKYNDKSLTDLFFFYNLIIFKDKNRNGSFNPLLGSVPDNYENNSAMATYKEIIAGIDKMFKYNGIDEINIYDLFSKGYAKQISYLPKKNQGTAIRIYNPEGQDSIYVWEDTSENTGEYIEITNNVIDKYLNIDNDPTNHILNMDKIKTHDDKVLILKNNISKFIRTTLVDSVNC